MSSMSGAGVLLVGGVLALASGPAAALDYQGAENQFGGSFAPANAPYGGFGGAAACSASRTPVVFLHGNGDEARNWDYPASTGVPSVYDAFKAAGYKDCELFGLNWLSASERGAAQLNYHKHTKAAMVRDFINAVKAYTGKTQVDVVGHSMGVTVGLHGIDYGSLWSSVRRFISISGGLRGLASCYWAGYANPYVTTCGSQNYFDSQIFGFFPHLLGGAYNPRTGDGGFRDRPSGKATRFYSLRAGYQDQVLCSTASYYVGCDQSAVFDAYTNVYAQLDVGSGSTAAQVDYDFSDWSPYNAAGGDLDGVGHFRAKNNTGQVQARMLTTTCSGTGCCTGYAGTCTP
jgi:pimeloyl-ACP methyl ester carboxylesterase